MGPPVLLRATLNNSAHAGQLQGKLLTEELVKSLDKIRDVEGVLRPTSLSNKSLLRTLATSGSRGSAFEALLAARLVEPAALKGAKITVGRRWWLQAIEEANVGRARPIQNVLEADILVELANGRRILVDAKFFPVGMNVEERLANQLEKISSGIDEGIIHGAEYWVSDSIEELRDAFELHTELTGKEKIRLEQNVIAKGFPEDFFDMERRVATVDRNGAILILDAEKATPEVISKVANRAADRILGPLVPTPPSLGYRIPMATQAATIVARSKLTGDGSTVSIPVNPLGTASRVTVTGAPAHAPADTPVSTPVLLRAHRDSALATHLAGGQPAEVSDAELTTLVGAGQLCGLSAGLTQAAVACVGRSVPLRDRSGAQYLVLVQRAPTRGSDRVFVQAVLFDGDGRTLRAYPDSPTALELRSGRGVAIPFSPQARDGPTALPYPEGGYGWGLRLTGGDGRTQVHPGVLPMLVQQQ